MEDVFFYFVQDEIDDKYVIGSPDLPDNGKKCGSQCIDHENNGELKDEIHSIKMIMGKYFQNISEGVNDLASTVNSLIQKQEKLEERICQIETITNSTVDELTEIILQIVQDIGEDPEKLKDTLINDIGKNSITVTLQKVKSVIEKKDADSEYISKIEEVLELME